MITLNSFPHEVRLAVVGLVDSEQFQSEYKQAMYLNELEMNDSTMLRYAVEQLVNKCEISANFLQLFND